VRGLTNGRAQRVAGILAAASAIVAHNAEDDDNYVAYKIVVEPAYYHIRTKLRTTGLTSTLLLSTFLVGEVTGS